MESGGLGSLPRGGGLGLLNPGMQSLRGSRNANTAFGSCSKGLRHPPRGAAGRFALEGSVLLLKLQRHKPGREENDGGEHGSGVRQPGSLPTTYLPGSVTLGELP